MKRTHLFFSMLFPVLGLAGLTAVALGDVRSSVVEMAPAVIVFDTRAPYYEPFMAAVQSGVPVRWLNPTASPHSVRHDGCATEGPCAFQSSAVPPNDSFTIAPLPPGRYSYHCELHPVMRGVLMVLDPQEAGAHPAGAAPQ